MILAGIGIHAFLLFAVAIREQVTAYPKGPGCGALLTDALVGNSISGSSSLNSSFNESYAILNNTNAWCSLTLNPVQYLSVSLDKPTILAGFEIQGRSSTSQYVTQFKIRYKEENEQQIFKWFPANQQPFTLLPSNGDDIVYFSLNGTKMQTIGFYPSQWNDHICMRLELYGCVIVDGGYTPWSDWTPCSNSCGNGTSVRYRSCSDPVPLNGGENCTGESFQMKECVGLSCSVDGGFSDWSNWTPCSASCGTGCQLRTRNCSNPLPVHDGKLCDSRNSSEARTCAMPVCQQPGNPAARSDDGKDENKYFLPMLVLAVAFAIFIVIAVAVICVLRNGSEHNWDNSIRHTSSERKENGETGLYMTGT